MLPSENKVFIIIIIFIFILSFMKFYWLVTVKTQVTDGRTDGRTDNAISISPSLFQRWGIIIGNNYVAINSSFNNIIHFAKILFNTSAI